jgi:hypothetical protein
MDLSIIMLAYNMYITPDDGDERLNCIDAPYSSIGNVI